MIKIVKSEIIDKTWKKVKNEFTQSDVDYIVNIFIDVIAKSIKNGEITKVEGLGTFSPYTRSAYDSKSMISGETLQHIPATRCVSFRPSKKLKE